MITLKMYYVLSDIVKVTLKLENKYLAREL